MLKLYPAEQPLLVIRRHWIVFVGPSATFFVLILVPPLILTFAPTFLPALRSPGIVPLVNFGLALYTLGLLTYMLVLWLAYYLDVWIITTERIIDIEQRGLFYREVSEIPMEKIQNVTIETPGFLATVLKFGTIKIQTASESDFVITEVPDCYRAKDLILRYSRVPRQTIPHEPETPIMAG